MIAMLHNAIGAATNRVLTAIGLLAAMVFGVTSPSSRISGNMTRMLIQPARSGP